MDLPRRGGGGRDGCILFEPRRDRRAEPQLDRVLRPRAGRGDALRHAVDCQLASGRAAAGVADRHGRSRPDRRQPRIGRSHTARHRASCGLRQAAGGDRAALLDGAHDRRLRATVRALAGSGELSTTNRQDGAPAKRVCLLCSLLVFALAGAPRLQGVDWDQGQHLHPDERFLTMVETAIAPPHSIAEYFDTARSPLNPSNHGYRFFVYGTLPLFLVRFLAQGLGMTGYEQLNLVGRTLSALFVLATLSLTVSLESRIGGRRVGLIAGALFAFSVTSIQ